ncbi:riboflavin kinase [Ralstonia pseudosolanacearum]
MAFTAFIRPERTFESIDDLREQIARDKQFVTTPRV